MFIATLIAPAGALDPRWPTRCAMRGAAGMSQWLAPDEAAEFTLARCPATAGRSGTTCRSCASIWWCSPPKGGAKRMLLADMDSTMIQQECIDELAEAAGSATHVREITARAMNGELDFEGALLERVALLKGLPEAVIDEVLATRITHAPGGGAGRDDAGQWRAYARWCRAGSPRLPRRWPPRSGLTRTAPTLADRRRRLTGDVARPILGREAKVDALDEISARLGIDHADVIAVGDGANDLGMLGLAGAGVALHAKPSVAAQCDIRINHGDLTALLYLQGYARDGFVGI